jgi:hypothetical protein
MREVAMSECRKGTLAARRPARALGLLVCLPVLAGLAACSTAEPFSYLDGERWTRVELDTYDTLILAVDGKSYGYNSRIRVDPGEHHIVFQTRPAAGFTFSPRKELVLNVEPCTRYYFEAKRMNALQQDFEPRVNYREPIAGCGSGLATNSQTEPGKRMGGY